MISPDNALEGVYEHKMDTKCRVSVPADWRVTVGNGYLRLLQSSNYDLKVLRVLTEGEYVNYLREVENREDYSYSRKKKVLGRLHSQILKTTPNPQGKLLIPKAWCDKPGLSSDGTVMLVGRGAYFEIYSPENYEEMLVREEAETAVLNEELGFF
jgi:MraZ protein